tara:strand:- start:5660 stop:5839 length:180 start_codon:yes stop_codon:yes gene_type:complete
VAVRLGRLFFLFVLVVVLVGVVGLVGVVSHEGSDLLLKNLKALGKKLWCDRHCSSMLNV